MARPNGHCSKETNAIFREKKFYSIKNHATVKEREYGKLGEQRKQISQKLQARLLSVQLLKMVLIGPDLSFVC